MSRAKKHPLSVSATQLSALGHCELMVALDLKETVSQEMKQAGDRGDVEHDRFHRSAVANAGTKSLLRKL